MRTYVSKCLIGTVVANTTAAKKAISALTDGQIIAFDYDTKAELLATSQNIGFARGTSVLGQAILAGPFPKKSIQSAILNTYAANVNQVTTLTVEAPPKDGGSVIVKVVYKDNLSLNANRMKQTVVSYVGEEGNTADDVAAAIAAELKKQEFIFVDVTVATNVITLTSKTVLTQSAYNSIDRPEIVTFEVGVTDTSDKTGKFKVATTTVGKLGQGDSAKMKWVEENSMGRRGYSDRRSWNDNKKYKSQVTDGTNYNTLVITGTIEGEGDMQDSRFNPIGIIIGASGTTSTALVADLTTAGVIPTTVAAS